MRAAAPAPARRTRHAARVEVLGIRHHGPGSARAVLAALDALTPDCVLIEGPADADPVLGYALSPATRAPVALLVHALEDPAGAVFYPFAAFSPEWVALRWALSRGVAVRFIDLPVALSLGLPEHERGRRREDPLAELAAAAGYADVDRFWDELVEAHRPRLPEGPQGPDTPSKRDPLAHFAAIHHALDAAREGELLRGETPLRERRREAHMRLQIGRAARDHHTLAVIVGAWHAPALRLTPEAALHPLRRLPTVQEDEALLKGLTRHKTHVAWVPWTHTRLSAESGYGAGVRSPGWYHHLFEVAEEGPAPGWAVRAARLLRGHDLGASPSEAVDVVRLAEALAALRDRPAPGLDELREAILAVLCQGDARRFALIEQALEVGDALGAVPPDAPATPLRRDLTAQMKALALKPTPTTERLHLDLRKERDLARTRLFHRLDLLHISWAVRAAGSGSVGAGTFKELWDLAWDPAYEVDLALASRWGNTLAQAASARLLDEARDAELPALAGLLERAPDAGLSDAIDPLLEAIADAAAATHDVAALGGALLPLARLVRYSDVRQTRAAEVVPIFEGLFWRLVAGFAPASRGLDEGAAKQRIHDLDAVELALGLLASAPDDPARPALEVAPLRVVLEVAPLRAAWDALLRELAAEADANARAHERIAGRATRLLLQHGALAAGELATLTALALGGHVEPPRAAAWVEGLIEGSGLLLASEDGLWAALDAWLRDLAEATFVEVLPILRRAFSAFSPIEKRKMGERLTLTSKIEQLDSQAIDPARAARLHPVLARLIGPRTAPQDAEVPDGR